MLNGNTIQANNIGTRTQNRCHDVNDVSDLALLQLELQVQVHHRRATLAMPMSESDALEFGFAALKTTPRTC